MAKSDGVSLTSRLLKRYQTSAVAETIFLVVLGITGVAVHAYLRLPIKAPGHQGLFWIGLLMAGRLVSRRRWAATTCSVSAAATSLLPILGFRDPFAPITFLIPGIVIDFGFRLSPRWFLPLWAIAVLGAVAHATKPMVRLLFSEVQYPSLVGGIAYPMALHGLFGAIGAIAAALSLKLIRARDQTGPRV